MKLVGLMPSNFNADDGRSYPGFRFYCTEENENAYGITTRSFWVKVPCIQEFLKEYFDGDPNRALGERIMVSCDFNGKPNRLLPYSFVQISVSRRKAWAVRLHHIRVMFANIGGRRMTHDCF